MDETFDRTSAPASDSTTTPQQRPQLLYGRRTWLLVLADVMAMAWMLTAGTWFDRRGVLTVITLGGHHRLVMILAAASFVILSGLAVSTEGFARASATELALLAVAVVLTVVAMAGLISLLLLVVAGGTFIGLLVKLCFR